MANLTPTPGWDNVFQLETDTPVLGGAGGVANSQAQALLNRFGFLEGDAGSSKVGYTPAGTGAVATTVEDILDAQLMVDYDALRAYTGLAKTVRITGLLTTSQPQGIAGFFQYDQTDTTSSDNGGTIIVGSDGRRWKRVQVEYVTPEMFGAKGDGGDDTAAFFAFQAYAVAQTDGVELRLTPGRTYGYTNPRWPMNILNMRVVGYGAELRNINVSSGLDVDRYPLITAPGLDRNQAAPGGIYAPVNNYLIQTATAGATSITTVTAGEAANFAANEWVMLSSFRIDTGGPNAFRYFEYAKVVSVNAGTGVVTIDRPLTSTHSSTLPTGMEARVWKIEQVAKWGIKQRYEGIRFSSQALTGVTAYPLFSGEQITLIDCSANNLVPTVAGSVYMENCETFLGFEGDKNVKKLHCVGGKYRGLSQFVGVDEVVFEDLEIVSTISFFTPNRAVFKNVTGYPANGFPLGAKRMDSFRIEGGIIGQVEPISVFGDITRGTNLPLVTLGGSVTLTNNNLLVLPNTAIQFINHATPNAVLREVTLLNGNYVCNGNYGAVRSVTAFDETNTQIIVDFRTTVGAGAILAFFRTPEITIKNCIFGRVGRAISYDPEIAYGTRIQRTRLPLSQEFPLGSVSYVEGVPKRIFVNVVRPATTQSFLSFTRVSPGSGTLASVNVSVAGVREVTQAFFSGNLSLDSGFSANLSRAASAYLSAIQVRYDGSGLGLQDFQQAVVDFVVEFDFPLLGR